LLQIVEYCFGSWVEKLCLSSWDNGSAKPVKEFASKVGFQILDMFAYSWLAGIQLISSFGKTSAVVDCSEYF
jgi:hypothetical protein